MLLPHVKAALPAESYGMEMIARFLGNSGSYEAARMLQQQIVDARMKEDAASGAVHPRTLTARDELAYWTGLAGDPAAARDQYSVLLPVFERVLGPEHPDTLTARANLASWTEAAGKGP